MALSWTAAAREVAAFGIPPGAIGTTNKATHHPFPVGLWRYNLMETAHDSLVCHQFIGITFHLMICGQRLSTIIQLWNEINLW